MLLWIVLELWSWPCRVPNTRKALPFPFYLPDPVTVYLLSLPFNCILFTPSFSITFLFLLIFCFFPLRRSFYFYIIYHSPFLIVLRFHFLLFSPLFLVIFSPPYAQFFYSFCCFFSSFVFYFSFLRFFLFVRFSPPDAGLKHLAVMSEEEDTKNALPLTILLSASQRHTFWLSLWCVTQYNKQV